MSESAAERDASPPEGAWPTIPGFEIQSELGRGGMGVVYQAYHNREGRYVALKVIRDGALASPQDRARLRIEADAIARVQHPNVVRILEVGERSGLPYLAMELAEGGSLDRRLDGRPAPAAFAADFARTLALAVQHAHDRGIVHRDLKPANILLRDREPRATGDETLAGLSYWTLERPPFIPLITDFGLAKRLDSDSTAWTQAGAVLGTASYMAPEQATGRTQDVGPAADIYALGAILYELLAGRPPFRGATALETIEQALRDDPPSLSRFGADVPPDLETVCRKCLEKEPARRYASAAELAKDLGRFLEGTPVLARPASERDRVARLAARDGFEIVAEIGRGPGSTVYRALLGPLRQPTALKVFDRDLCTEEHWSERLGRETVSRAALNHPQAPPPRQAGWWDGAPFLASEFAPQGSLADMLAARPLSFDAALRLVVRLADVVCYLHRQGIVHGNLKPTNVLFAADGIPRLVDPRSQSGLSFVSPSGETPTTSLAFLAPELLDDPAAEPRPVTDVYGLGAILYAALAGRPPFIVDTPGELLSLIRSSDPPPLRDLNPDVPPEIEAFCRRCLRKAPLRRYLRAYYVKTCLSKLLGEDEGTGSGRKRR